MDWFKVEAPRLASMARLDLVSEQLAAVTHDIDCLEAPWDVLVDRIRHACRNGVMQKELAHLAGCDHGNFSRWINFDSQPADGARVRAWLAGLKRKGLAKYTRLAVKAEGTDEKSAVDFLALPRATIAQLLDAISGSGKFQGEISDLKIRGWVLSRRSTWAEEAKRSRWDQETYVDVVIRPATAHPQSSDAEPGPVCAGRTTQPEPSGGSHEEKRTFSRIPATADSDSSPVISAAHLQKPRLGLRHRAKARVDYDHARDSHGALETDALLTL